MYMRKFNIGRTGKVVISLALVLAIAGGFFGYNIIVKNQGTVTDMAATRGDEMPPDGMVYIEPEMVSLAGELSGTAETQAAALAAFDAMNARRAQAGLPALAWNSGLEQAAAVRAVEAAQLFSHTRPDGSEWWTVNSNLMYGENLAKGYTTGDSVTQAWMDSPTHAANILDGGFTSVAIVVHVNSNGQWFWSQEFGY